MSGIAGIIRFDGGPVELGLVEKMTSAMSHRGPDGIHHWVKGSVALGQCMLRTTPESLEEHQPLANEDESLVLVMDGRVDNWEDLRKELLGRGAVLRNRSDAELVLRSYETWGKDCLAHIDGDFAFVIWDARSRTAFCARDRFGSKPLFYRWDDVALTLCSELSAMMELPSVPAVINEEMLAEYLAAEFVSNTETIWRGIMRLAPGHSLGVDSARAALNQYWRPDTGVTLRHSNDEEWFSHYFELLAQSVSRLSRTQYRVACEVSGGLDSSAVFSMVHFLQRSGRLNVTGVDGFTLAFNGDGPANEVAYARAVGDHLGETIHEITPEINALSWYEQRGRAKRIFPGYPNGVMSHGLYRRASQRGSRVLLNGIGGDEWLGGSRRYYAEQIAGFDWPALLRSVRNDLHAYGAAQTFAWIGRHGVFWLLPPAVQAIARRLVGKEPAAGSVPGDYYWLAPKMTGYIQARRNAVRPLSARPAGRAGQVALIGYLDDAHHHHAAEMTEQFGAEHGLEVRRPLYTRDLVQFAFSTPEHMRLRGAQDKYTHVKALRGFMPPRVLERREKAEFSLVFDSHLRQMKSYFVERVAKKRPDWLAADGMVRLFGEYEQDGGRKWTNWVLWSVFGCDTVAAGAR